MDSHQDSHRYDLLEAEAERKAIMEVDETSYVEIIRQTKTFNGSPYPNGVPTEWPSYEMKGDEKKDVKVRAQDIFDQGTWEKFLKWLGRSRKDLISLTSDKSELVEKYDYYLENVHSQLVKKTNKATGEVSYTLKYQPTRYNCLDAAGKIWRHFIVEKAVTLHLLLHKLESFLNQKETFADVHVAYYLKLNRSLKNLTNECARMNQHIIKDPELAKTELDRFFGKFYEEFQVFPFQQRDNLLRLMGVDQDNNAKGVALYE